MYFAIFAAFKESMTLNLAQRSFAVATTATTTYMIGALVMSTDMLRRLTNRRFIIIIIDHDTSTSQTDGQTGGQLALAIPLYA